jgi:hypothetical protein
LGPRRPVAGGGMPTIEAATLTRNVVPNEEATELEVLRAAAQLGVTPLAAASGKANIFNLTLLG